VQNRGIKASGQWLTALAKKSGLGRRRLGVTVSTKVGNSVLRSKVKRWLREAFRLHPEWVPDGIDLVLIARPGIDQADWASVLKDYERLGKALKAKLPAR
jgi:ribonuclease P protein component